MHPSYRFVALLGAGVGGLIAVVAAGVPWYATQRVELLALPAAVLVVAVLVVAVTPRRVRAIRYRLRSDDLLVARGIMWRRTVAVPYGRMQVVDVLRGPIARAFGLAELKLVTAAAATAATIPGLAEADAEALRDRLVALAETRRAGL